eukprot:TRINITY_DN4658_c0_g1::TRINITY_DN4658_c0_g1_i1::g.19547::m.19547 TRINITY_DN4658_c0_g1::TRINITY_DN4658_c0_g1_i1::g.19547  ORF type:complete len:513 (+),score=88.09,sp/Q5R962/TRM11_PONAB/32.91/4e-80,UPF0020/PF01170.13/2.8e-10,Methyltransf_26/PF13659.1/3.9e-08,N6_N4_Mtase/PF01555.13/1.1,N6_N4_Mtase/PF01555.13/75,N6_Mtase/PF02384.11/0.49 TRINITY_DN4658_c0_g1_i1:175-1539(+)
MELPNEETVRRIAARSLLVYGFVEPWGEGASYEECIQACAQCDPSIKTKYLSPDVKFRFDVYAFGRGYNIEEQVERINRFASLGFKGKVNLKKPEVEMWILEDIGLDRDPKVQAALIPRKVFCGRLISRGRRDLGNQYTLKKRGWVGPTSMDAELSFIMANQALIREGSLVYDPYVGTGSILVSCAAFGGWTFGADLNILILRGKEGRNIKKNFEQYGMGARAPDLIRCDIANPPYRSAFKLDAIVCDPPYGIRATSKTLGKKSKPQEGEETQGSQNSQNQAPSAEATTDNAGDANDDDSAPLDADENVNDNNDNDEAFVHIPQTKQYSIPDSILALVSFAASHLRIGGRLVFWLPVTPTYTDNDVPRHPAMQLIANSLQPLTMRWGRRLITMEKLRDPTPQECGFYEQTSDPCFHNFKQYVFTPGENAAAAAAAASAPVSAPAAISVPASVTH